jgi:hypothetical protein
MRFDALQEAAAGNCLVRIRSSRFELPEAGGWIGSWEIYHLPWHHRKLPAYTGETDVQTSKSLAAGWRGRLRQLVRSRSDDRRRRF